MNETYSFGSLAAGFYATRNPAQPAQIVGRYGRLAEAEIEQMVIRAGAAQQEWSRVSGLERGLRLNQFLDAVVARVDDIAKAVTLEQGKILAESRMEILKGAAEGRFMVGEAARMGSTSISNGRAGFSNQILRRPRGVIFCISPWNFPAMTPLRKACPAIAFGNAVILKPSQFTPAASYLLEEIARPFFPKNLFQIAMISGQEASRVIATGAIHGVSFTGSVGSGKLVYAAAAQNLIPAQLELGGKNAAILHDTEDLDTAIAQIAGAAFQTAGQRCTALSRVLVNKALAAPARKKLAEAAGAIRLGDGMLPDSQMGPLCNGQHWEQVRDMTAQAVAQGAKPLVGGSPAPGAGEQNGYFFQPTVLSDVKHDDIASQVEIFGPVLSILEYQEFDEAMTMLNGTEFGLTSALFSNSNAHVQRFLRESNHGMIHVNHGTIPDNNMPFGGVKHSGVGAYSVGPTAVNFYTSEHSAYIAC